MKLRTKLIFLVIGVVIIPVLVSGLIGYYLHLRREWVPSPKNIQRLLGEFEKVSLSAKDRSYPKAPAFSAIELPKGLSVWVLDVENRVIYTNKEGSVENEHFNPSGIGRGILLVHPIAIDGTTDIKVMLQFPPGPENVKKRGPFFVQFIERSMWWLFTLIVFSSAMITIILRSFNRAIGNLNKATKRIADGDLDSELTAEGNDEIASLTRSFDSMRKNLKESIARRSRFLMGISHDLKTPLTSIKGYLEAISDGLADDPEKLGRYLSVINQKSKTLEERIGKLIDYVHMETGDLRMGQEEINISDFLTRISEMYGEDASVFKRIFRSDIQIPGQVFAMGDKTLLLRCFENLFDNALRYTEEGDTITLSAFQKDDEVLVVFQDTGIGIEKHELHKVFEPFYRATRSRREQGSGLGLSIVKSIIDAHGWRIGIESIPGKATTLTIHISPVKIN